jgi:hypothetical protein
LTATLTTTDVTTTARNPEIAARRPLLPPKKAIPAADEIQNRE